ncbi:MAG: ArsR family transcriptional regulator [Pseudazoarcus pumilus]|nr:ArsR family transcriptional regulator [Pseudazoarcus pumilus]
MAEHILAALNALGQGTRLEAFRLLVRAGPQGLSVGELALRLDVPVSTLSRHLDQLQQGRLLRTWRDGRHVLHAIDWDGTRALLAYLTEDCCQGLAACGTQTPGDCS